MSGPKRNPDKLNTIGVIVVGICGAVLVYVTITALQAFYMNDSSSVQTAADYNGQDQTYKGARADQLRNIGEYQSNAGADTFRIKIEDAMKLVVEDAKKDPTHLTGASMPPSTKASIEPVFGRPKLGGPAPAAAPAAAGSGAGSAAQGSAAPAQGSAAPNAGASASSAPQTSTGQGAGGASGASPSSTNAPGNATGSGGANR